MLSQYPYKIEGARDYRSRQWSEAATSQGMLTATRSWKRQGKDFPLEPPEVLADTDFGPVVLTLNFQPSEL